nr:poly(A) polymerase I-like isoform X1 [Tanacetum cinerariifolium]
MSCFASLERVDESDGLSSSNSVGGRRMWKKFSSKELGITNTMISKPTRIVLNGLKRQDMAGSSKSQRDFVLAFVGFDAYLVGGCVRDLILKRPPKDIDVLTTTELKEVS